MYEKEAKKEVLLEMEIRERTIETAESTDIGRVLKKLKDTIRNGTPEENYTIADRDNYKELKRCYVVPDQKVRKILLRLGKADFIKSEPSNHPRHPQDTVYVFKKRVRLMPRFEEHAKLQNITIYIKFTWPVECEDKLLIISFHEDKL